jgi:hypothetical protein
LPLPPLAVAVNISAEAFGSHENESIEIDGMGFTVTVPDACSTASLPPALALAVTVSV